MPRDPRLDPQPGDRVRANGNTRLVRRRNGGNIFYHVEEQVSRYEKNCWISTWVEWCRRNKAEVVKEAPMPDHERVAKEIAAYVASWKGTSCDDPGIHAYAITEILRRSYGDVRRDALEEVEKLMGRVLEEHKAALDYAEDGRYAWPERWSALAAAIRKLKEEARE